MWLASGILLNYLLTYFLQKDWHVFVHRNASGIDFDDCKKKEKKGFGLISRLIPNQCQNARAKSGWNLDHHGSSQH